MSIIVRSPVVASVKILDRIHQAICFPGLIEVKPKIYVVDIPKSGSSFLKSSLIASGNCSFSLSSRYPHTGLFRRPLRGKALTDVSIYAFVRDPLDRFCSVVREKLINSSLHHRGWCPFASSFGRHLYNPSNVDAMIEDFTSSPLSLLDKHVLPQSYFWSSYFCHPGFRLLPLSSMSDFIISCGIDSRFFPDSAVSLVTDKSAFSPSSLSESSLRVLSSFYRSDFLALNILQT